MNDGIVAIIVSLVSAIASIVTPVLTSRATQKDVYKVKKEARKHAAKQSILQMIMQDELNVMQGKLPENFENILTEFDEYTLSGGNSYMHQKIDEYVTWYKKLNKKD